MRVHRNSRILVSIVVASLSVASCGGSGSSSTETTAPIEDSSPQTISTGAPVPDTPVCASPGVRACLLPWPDNRLTVNDESTVTGRRLAIPADATPVNVDGTPIDVTDQNRADGFSPNSAIVFAADGVDLEASGVPDANHIDRSLDDSTPIAVIDNESGEKVAFWGEVDPPSGLVTLRPAQSYIEGHTYTVTIAELVDATGVAIDLEVVEWEFTVASAESLSGRLLHEKQIAYEQLGGGVPVFTVGSVTAGDSRLVDGTLVIPNFLDNDGSPGGSLLFDDAGMPMVNPDHPTYAAPYRCVVPNAVASPVKTILYGHGLMGDRGQVDFFGSFAAQGMIAGCAVDWMGMSSSDLANEFEILSDMSRFNEQADRMLQGHIAFLMLGRLVNDPRGFASDPAFQDATGSSVLAEDGAVFVGNSQGGILGGAVSAVSDEWTQVVLGVPGINYSLLLPRSSDWPEFQAVFNKAYTDDADRLMALMLVQLLWDRGENGGYARHLTGDTYDGVESPKNVLLVGAYGDHQVANVSTATLARTIGALVHTPVMTEGRIPDGDPFWGIGALDEWSGSGAVLEMWDYGTPTPPTGPTAPFEPDYGKDPHGAGSDEPMVLTQALTFLITNALLPVCGDGACVGTPAT